MKIKYSISHQGLELIKQFEGLVLEAMIPVRKDVLTIGYGHTLGVREGQRTTKQEAERWLRDDVNWAEAVLNKYVRVPLDQNQTDALISFIFNIGEKQFRRSTLLKELNKRNYENIDSQLARYKYSSGIIYRGLVRRRKAEADLFTDFEPHFVSVGVMPKTCETCPENQSVFQTAKESRKAKGAIVTAGLSGTDIFTKINDTAGQAETLASKFSGLVDVEIILPVLIVCACAYIFYLQHDDKNRQRAY